MGKGKGKREMGNRKRKREEEREKGRGGPEVKEISLSGSTCRKIGGKEFRNQVKIWGSVKKSSCVKILQPLFHTHLTVSNLFL